MARFNVVARLSDRRRHAGVVRRLAAPRALRALQAPTAIEVLEFDQVAALQVRIAGHQRLQRDVRMARSLTLRQAARNPWITFSPPT